MLFTCNQALATPLRHSAEFRDQQFTVTVTEAAGGKEILMSSDQALQILNTIVRNSMAKLKLARVRRDLFDNDPKAVIKMIELKLQIWPGYITSIRQHDRGRLMCVELAHKIIRQDTCFHVLNSSEVQSAPDPQKKFKELMLGSVVMTTYNDKDYKICDVDFKQSPLSTFKKHDGSEISFKDYFQQRYSVKMVSNNQPMLLSKVTRRQGAQKTDEIVALIPELVRPTGLTDAFRANFRHMKMLDEKTKLGPQERRHRIYAFRQRIQDTPEASRELSDRHIELSKELVQINGRTIPYETIIFGDRKEIKTDEKVDWTFGFRNNKLYATESLKRWMVVTPKNCEGDARQFIGICKQVSRSMAIEFADPHWELIDNDRLTTYAEKIEECCRRDPRFIFIVVPNNNADRYAAIKKITCVHRSIPSQVILKKNTFSKKGPSGLMSIATKVMIQIVCKLGGAPWMITLPVQGVMTIGFDVTHGKTSGTSYGTKSPSFGAFVASMDLQKVVKYYSGIVEHRGGEEISGKLRPQVQQALATYMRFHNCLPNRIVFYRDGVGSGQMQAVIDTEIEAVKTAIKETYGSTPFPPFTFIVVNKRLNTRIFLRKNDHVENPFPGTVVDDVITQPDLYDFYLISQSVRMGTVSPTSYTILETPPEDKLDATKLQYFTWKNCHLYYNWSGK
jgi:aubergine